MNRSKGSRPRKIKMPFVEVSRGEMFVSAATIHVVGVGPGDPDLLTLRAAQVIDRCDLILHPGPRDEAGFAYEVIKDRLRPGQRVRGMALAMRRGPDDGSVGYDRVVNELVEASRGGRSSAFLTEGDP